MIIMYNENTIVHKYLDGSRKVFDNECMVKNWYQSIKDFLHCEEHILQSSTVDHFIIDNDNIVVKFVTFNDKTMIVDKYEKGSIEIIMYKDNIFDTFEAYREYCIN